MRRDFFYHLVRHVINVIFGTLELVKFLQSLQFPRLCSTIIALIDPQHTIVMYVSVQ